MTIISVALYSLQVNKMLMILPATLLLGALGYLFYTSKKELSLDHLDPLESQKENDDLYKDLKDLYI